MDYTPIDPRRLQGPFQADPFQADHGELAEPRAAPGRASYLTTRPAEMAEALYPEHLAREFGGHPVLDSITVEHATDGAGEKTFQVALVYQGDGNTIDAPKLIRVLTAIATPLE